MGSYMEGPLSKWTNVMKGWQYRWFVLDDNAGLLSYYTSREKMMRGSRRGCVRLCSAIIGIDDEDDSTFTITVDQKIFHFQARDREEREQWVSSLEDTITRHSKRLHDVQSSSGALEDFDKKLAEADAYMKILIKKAKAFERKLNMTENPEERQKYEEMQITAMELVESVKQSIVMLQIAKNAIVPADETHIEAPVSSNETAHTVQFNTTGPQVSAGTDLPIEDTAVVNNGQQSSVEAIVNGIHDITEKDCNEGIQPPSIENLTIDSSPSPASGTPEAVVQELGAASISQELPDLLSKETKIQEQSFNHTDERPAASIYTGHDFPTKSYSSSDEEDDEFYDADERVGESDEESLNKPPMPIRHDRSEPVLHQSNEDLVQNDVKNIESLDDIYMQEDDHAAKDGESVEEHKSVIMHLLSQVKLGMDLTKVVLPTFILERRSLLEMYADFFAHPDLFVGITEGQTPADRMVRCLRWYMSSFHAGRKGSVAKKPYNPILGESFHCFYNLPDMPPDEYKVSDGPVPWAHRNNVSFTAEQVSHHPPISGFYAEHVNKRIQFNAHIWTKSKFLGLSIGVHNLGQGCVRLLEREEEYIMNFPNGYGRSILTVPWVELGGDCNITCEQTGYTANITFHTKPFYGGKVHKISAEVLAPNEKKPIITIDGEWNGIMYMKTGKGKNECFIDTKKMPTVTKVVKKIEHQENMESRKLWKDVTHNLKTNNIDEATAGKRKLEEKQRQDAKYRLENNIKYDTINFKEDESGNWIYKYPLINRI
ncbi:oxysterol-binding protein-related protein 9-like [Styela clava]